MKVLVCGGRDFSNAALLTSVLDDLHHARGFTLLIHGGARGADALAAQWAGLRQIPVRQFSDFASHQSRPLLRGAQSPTKAVDNGLPTC